MKIEDNRKVKEVTFKDLLPGDCFIYLDTVYLKIDKSGAFGNTFDLESNCKCSLNIYDEVVTPVNAKVVIE